ncbi:MAG: hypothetical protein ABI481_00640 [Pyrinomonadaceae bacterium]
MIASTLPARGVTAAEITVSGPREGGEKPFVMVNGERAFSGRSFFSDGAVSTTDTSSATFSLGKLGRIELAPASSLSLSFSEGRIVGALSKGSLTVSNMDGVAVTIDTPSDSVSNEGTSSSQFTVAVIGNQTGLAVEHGTVRSQDGKAVSSKKDDDDDDDDSWRPWATVAVIGGIIAAVVIIIALSDDDDNTVSPVR